MGWEDHNGMGKLNEANLGWGKRINQVKKLVVRDRDKFNSVIGAPTPTLNGAQGNTDEDDGSQF